ncbi:hypothetical protein [Dyadobacter sp. NIV53]|uniref:hypothetical protein n=1 Tax=Dyadobacter sp. NIV53 TaxID=2861765 RepID=UPI001C87D6A4|nr:hypothetical protein [Dyadobacter sp. NIV53]
MKTILLLGIVGCLYFSVSVQAQLQKGTKYWAGTIRFNGINSTSKIDTYSYKSNFNYFSVSPSIQTGWFIKDNRLVGIGIGSSINFSRAKNKSDDQSNRSGWNRNSFSLSPYIRQYKSVGKKWAIFLNSSADLSYLRYADMDGSEKTVENGYSFGVKVVPGISYWISPRFAIESDVNLLSLQLGYQKANHTNSVFFDSGVTTALSNYFSIRASWYLQ